jgi:hypothetical protein
MHSTPTASSASCSDAAAERHLRVAVGFSRLQPTDQRRGRFASSSALEFAGLSAINPSSVATRRTSLSPPNRGLKPTATITSSLRDEEEFERKAIDRRYAR